MRLIDTLRDPARWTFTGVPAIASWRVYLIERQEVDVALRRALFGGPYSPPAIRSSASAEVFIQWADGRCTQSTLNRTQLLTPSETLPILYSQSYPDPYPEHVPGPTELPDLRVCVPEIKAAVLEDASVMVPLIQQMAQELRRLPTEQIRANFGATYSRVTFVTSEGADSSHETTRVNYGATISSRATFSHDLRQLPTPEQIAARLKRVREDYEVLERPRERVLETPRVFLVPTLSRMFLNYFLLQNLSMQNVLNGVSAFTRRQLEDQEQLFHPSLTITDHPLRDDHPTAFRLCARGQVPQARALIQEGRLLDADISLRAATQGGLDPTPTAMTENWIVEGTPTELDSELTSRQLDGIDDAVLLYSVLGLHTSDPVRAAYSLGVPRAMVIEGGRPTGFIRGTVVGNFFEDLRAPLDLRQDPLSELPILPLQARFIPQ